ncbi:MAG: cyclase family protein [Desulfobacteraceae bacterium]|nr:cyclase family protein [Desulfobacteraceae bacterium]
MTKRFIDLSVHIENNEHTDHPGASPRVTYITHQETAEMLSGFFPGLKKDDLPDGEGWAIEKLELSTHNGTHMDAPWHYHSTTNEGKTRAQFIDEIPLDYCLRPGVKLDFRHLPDGHVVSAAEVEDELARIGHELKPLDIVLVNTSAGTVFGQPGYVDKGCGMGRQATLYLTERGIRVVGTDAWSWDAPFNLTAKRWEKTPDPSIIWEGHKAGREIPYWQMEKLGNLETLPPDGFAVACFPVKIRNASAGWVRAVAILD